MRSSTLTGLLLAACLYGWRGASAQNTDTQSAREIGNCIAVSEITGSRILDDETILLEMGTGPDVLMHLEDPCPQLRFHDFFSYQPTLGQLCAAIDRIVTRAGASCEIGGFSQAPARNPPDSGGGTRR